MKTTLTCALLLAGLSSISSAQILGRYEFHGNDQNSSGGLNTNPAQSSSLSPTYVADGCISLSKITPVDNSYTPHPRSWSTNTYDSSFTSGPTSAGGMGLSGNHADCFSGWSSSYNNQRTLSFDVTFANQASGSVSGISFDIGNYGGYRDPNRFKLVVLRNGSQIYSSSGNTITSSWQNKSFNLASAVSAANLSSAAGETTTFTFKLGAYGTNTNQYGMIAMDDIKIFGKHECVPEPSTAALGGLSVLALCFRRKRS